MSSSPVKRKLSAILAADAVGYSRMMGANEEATLKTLSAHRAVIDGIIEFHDGRIVGTAGDSVLAEFGSPVEAVRCAVEIQDALRTRNDSLPEERRLQFRVGVNLGDVMIKGNDLLGDGVNVAARLEGIAEPGGICISASVYDLIRGKLDLGFHDIGEQSLKNIEHPIRVYRVARDGGVPPGSVRKARRKDGRGALVGLGVLVATAAGYGYFIWLPQQRAAAQAELARAAAQTDAATRQATAAGATAEQAQRALQAERAATAKAKADAEVARAHAETEAAKRKAEAELAAATRARDAARREAEAARAAAKAAAEKAAVEKAAAETGGRRKTRRHGGGEAPARARPAPALAPAAAAPHHYDGSWSATIACDAINELPARTFEPARLGLERRIRAQRTATTASPGSSRYAASPTPTATSCCGARASGAGAAGGRGRRSGRASRADSTPTVRGQRRVGQAQCSAKLARAE